MSKQKNIPIIVGVGQVVDHWDGLDPSQAPSPISLATQSIERALADTGNSDLQNDMDTLAVVRAFTDSLSSPFDPFGKAMNFPAAIAQAAEIKPQQIIYSPAGGEQPQSLVNELSQAIANGDIRTAMIVGSEANAALKTALKRSVKLDWASDVSAEIQDRGDPSDS